MGLDESKIPGLDSLTEEKKKKKPADTFKYIFFLNHCVHDL